MPAPAGSNPVVSAILSETENPELAASLLLGSGLESGWNPTELGDSGHAYGAFQIHPEIWGGPGEKWFDPKYSVENWAYGQYLKNIFSGGREMLWLSNPEQAAEQTAYAAEGPKKDYYVSHGTATVDYWWGRTLGELRRAGYDTSMLGKAPVTPAPQPGGGSDQGKGNGSSNGGDQGCPTECVVPCAPCHKAPGILKGVICPPCYACEKIFGKCGSSSTPNPLDPFGVIDTVPKALSFLFSLRFLEILGGGVLIIVGLILLGKQVTGGAVPVPVP